MSLDSISLATKVSTCTIADDSSVLESKLQPDKVEGLFLLDLPQEILDEIIDKVLCPGAHSSVVRGMILTNRYFAIQTMAVIPKKISMMNRWVVELCGAESNEKLKKRINLLIGPSTPKVICLILETSVSSQRRILPGSVQARLMV